MRNRSTRQQFAACELIRRFIFFRHCERVRRPGFRRFAE
jgi:hypothetical protein